MKNNNRIEDYWTAVEQVAEAIVSEYEDVGAHQEDQEELLARLVHEQTDQHEYVIDSELQIHTLQFSNQPCASFAQGTLPTRLQGHDSFPFSQFAADAFVADVNDKVMALLKQNGLD